MTEKFDVACFLGVGLYSSWAIREGGGRWMAKREAHGTGWNRTGDEKGRPTGCRGRNRLGLKM